MKEEIKILEERLNLLKSQEACWHDYSGSTVKEIKSTSYKINNYQALDKGGGMSYMQNIPTYVSNNDGYFYVECNKCLFKNKLNQ